MFMYGFLRGQKAREKGEFRSACSPDMNIRKKDRLHRLHRLHRVHQFGLSILFVRSCCRDIENTTLLHSSAADDDDEFCFSDTDATHTPKIQ